MLRSEEYIAVTLEISAVVVGSADVESPTLRDTESELEMLSVETLIEVVGMIPSNRDVVVILELSSVEVVISRFSEPVSVELKMLSEDMVDVETGRRSSVREVAMKLELSSVRGRFVDVGKPRLMGIVSVELDPESVVNVVAVVGKLSSEDIVVNDEPRRLPSTDVEDNEYVITIDVASVSMVLEKISVSLESSVARVVVVIEPAGLSAVDVYDKSTLVVVESMLLVNPMTLVGLSRSIVVELGSSVNDEARFAILSSGPVS